MRCHLQELEKKYKREREGVGLAKLKFIIMKVLIMEHTAFLELTSKHKL